MIEACLIGPSIPLCVSLRAPSGRGGLSRCSGGTCAREVSAVSKATDRDLIAKLDDRLRHAIQYQRDAELAIEDATELLVALKAVWQSREEKNDG